MPRFFCMAPWVHAFHHSDYSRAACCIAVGGREYTELYRSKSKFLTHDEFKNIEPMRRMRLNMLQGHMPEECTECHSNAHNLNNSYASWFNKTYGHLYDDVLSKTNLTTGETSTKPLSFDYRIGNTCNSRCRHCTSLNSSLIEYDQAQLISKYNNTDYAAFIYNYQSPRQSKRDQQYDILQNELEEAIAEQRIKDIRWLGGESLFSPLHWEVMNQLGETDVQDTALLYITNLSIIEYKGIKLTDIITKKFKDVHIHCSSEGAGAVYNYIRAGLDWDKFVANFYTLAETMNVYTNNTRVIKSGFTINNLSLISLNQFIDFIIDSRRRFPNSVSHPHIERIYTNGESEDRHMVYLHPQYLGPYKQAWLEEFHGILDSREHDVIQYAEYFVNDVRSILDIIEKEPIIDRDNDSILRQHILAQELDQLNKMSNFDDLIKDTMLTEWYAWFKSNLV
jgi:hypothetical protein